MRTSEIKRFCQPLDESARFRSRCFDRLVCIHVCAICVWYHKRYACGLATTLECAARVESASEPPRWVEQEKKTIARCKRYLSISHVRIIAGRGCHKRACERFLARARRRRWLQGGGCRCACRPQDGITRMPLTVIDAEYQRFAQPLR